MAGRGPRQLAQAASHRDARIWEWLRDEHGAEVSLSTVTRAVARLGRESAVEPGDAFVDLVWHPDEARADFGEVDVLYGGAVQRMRRFVPDFPYSNIGLAQLMPGENAECACQALLDLFEWLGGVPERIVFDDAAGVGRGTRAPVPGVPGALRVRELPVLRRTPDTRRAPSRRRSACRAPQAVRARDRRVEPRKASTPRLPGQVPGARRDKPRHSQGRGGRPVLFAEGRKALLPLPSKPLRRGHVETHEGRQARRGHA